MKSTVYALATLALAGLGISEAQAVPPSVRIERLAVNVQSDAIQLSRDLREQFWHSPDYRALRAYNFRLFRAADTLSDMASCPLTTNRQMRVQVDELSYNLAHMRELVTDMEQRYAACQSPVDQYGRYGRFDVSFGHRYGCQLSRRANPEILCETLTEMEDTVHRMKHITGQCSCSKYSVGELFGRRSNGPSHLDPQYDLDVPGQSGHRRNSHAIPAPIHRDVPVRPRVVPPRARPSAHTRPVGTVVPKLRLNNGKFNFSLVLR